MEGQLILIDCPDGKRRSFKEASQEYGTPVSTLWSRYKRGKSVAEMFTKNPVPNQRTSATPVPAFGKMQCRTKAQQHANLEKLASPTAFEETLYE